MATLVNIPFELTISTKNLSDDGYREITLTEFYESVLDLKKQYRPELRILENRNLYVKLTSSYKDSILDMDGFDGIDMEKLRHSDGFYLKETEHFVNVFSAQNYPLPPGIYILKVVCNGKAYYTGFEVMPAAMERSCVWHAMLAEVLDNVSLQSMEYAFIRSVARTFDASDVYPHMLWKMLVLNQRYTSVIAALRDIKSNPHSRLVKKYGLLSRHDNITLDLKSLRLNASKNHKANKIFALEKVTSFNLIENRYLKTMLRGLDVRIQQCLEEAERNMLDAQFDLANVYYSNEKETPEYLRKAKVNGFLKEQCDKIKKLKLAIGELCQVKWIKELLLLEERVVSTQSFSDPRYNVIYSLYSKLDKISKGYSNDKQITMLWKRTSLMYEYWNIISIVKSLSKIGFKISPNDNVVESLETIKIKQLNSGDCFSFRSEDKRYLVNLYYEKNIPSTCHIEGPQFVDRIKDAKKMTDKLTQPLYTIWKNNSPDCRLDFYRADSNGQYTFYEGSLVIDFKYRKRQAVWNDINEYQGFDKDSSYIKKDNDCSQQLKNYKKMETIYYGLCSGSYKDESIKDIRPVHEVWALYPNLDEPHKVEYKSGFGIRLISSLPGCEGVLENNLKKFIDSLFPDFYNCVK